jgi:hypothetical protein
MKEQTYTQKVHYRIVIEGDYSCANCIDEELYNRAEDYHDLVWEHVADNICDFYPPNIELTNLRTIAEG